MLKMCCFFMLMLVGFKQGAPDAIDNTAALLKKGNAQELSKLFSSSIELAILKDEGIYSSTQAQLILDSFFKSNVPKSVTIVHTVKSNPYLRFAVLLLNTSTGVYRTSVSLKLVNGKFELNELRIESEKK